MADAAAFAHPAGSDDDLRVRIVIQGFRFVGRNGRMQAFKPDRIEAFLHHRARLLIQAIGGALQENGGGFVGQRAVHIDRETGKFRKQVILLDLPEEKQQLLGAPDGKRRNDHRSSPAEGGAQDLRQNGNRIPGALMVPCSIGGFDHQVIRIRKGLRIPDDRLVEVSDVPAADQLPGRAAFRERELNKGRTQQVPCVGKADGQPFVNHHGLAVFARNKALHGLFDVLRRIKGLNLPFPCAKVLFCLGCRVRFLDVRAVLQHDGAEIDGFRRRVDGTGEAFADQQRKQPGMVNMGMSDENIFNPGSRNGHFRHFIRIIPLLHPAVHQKITPRIPFDQRFAAGHLMRRTDKGNLHCLYRFLQIFI